jgi:hypothetical protein
MVGAHRSNCRSIREEAEAMSGTGERRARPLRLVTATIDAPGRSETL